MKPFVNKPRMKCEFIRFDYVGNTRFAWIQRLEDHPKLGPPNPNKVTRTSAVVRRGPNEIETLNSIYWW